MGRLRLAKDHPSTCKGFGIFTHFHSIFSSGKELTLGIVSTGVWEDDWHRLFHF
jgi:hypothetical protein